MTWLVRITFAVLVAATVAAFFVTQRLKRSPAIVFAAHWGPRAFSPNGDGVHDRAFLRFRLRKSDDVTVSVVNDDGDIVRTLTSSRSVTARRPVRLSWNGRDTDGRRAPDAYYRARIGLRHQGRVVVSPGVVKLDTKAPHPIVAAVQGRSVKTARTPLFVTAGHVTPVTVRFRGKPTRHTTLIVERTDVSPTRIVARAYARERVHTIHWDGLVDGGPPPVGVYRLRVSLSDLAANAGRSAKRAPGTGMTVRAVAVQPPLTPTRAGTRGTVFVDARRHHYRWALREIGRGRVLERGAGRSSRLRVRAPEGDARLDVLTVTANGHSTAVPFLVGSPAHRHVLVVLPALRWLAHDAVDDDGDGVPNTLDRGEPVPLYRVLDALPDGVRTQEGALLAFLDSRADRYEVTTDAALALGQGPSLAGHTGVLLAGQETWLPPSLAIRLRHFVERGGRVATFSIETMRRRVHLAGNVLTRPGPLSPRDALRARLGPLVHRHSDITAFPPDKAGLFTETDGLFRDWPAHEATRGLPGQAGPLSAAGPDPQSPVILAYALGKGEVIRAGVPGWAARLDSDPSVSGLTDRAWTLLSR